MKVWQRVLLRIAVVSGVSAYLHHAAAAALATAGASHWAGWAETTALCAGIVSAVAGFATFVAFLQVSTEGDKT